MELHNESSHDQGHNQGYQAFRSTRGPQVNIVHGFELVKQEHLKDIGADVKLYRHLYSGAELVSISSDDTNKTFAVAFGTPPQSHNGLPHILEHTVLTGSTRYPVKDPFMALAKSSLNTFLNAMTYPDMTLYPVSSMNDKDFYNLVDVYLDAVFNPLLRKESFEQEGWHYKIDESDPANVEYGGVVFNEMKGAYSTPTSHMYLHIERNLYPDNAYGLDSGGDPRHIPELTFDEFKDFHARYYHPSNARLYFYGNDPEVKRLEKADEFLREFEALPLDSRIPLQQPFAAPKVVEATYPAAADDDLSEKHLSTVNWLLPEADDTTRAIGFQIIQNVLLGNPGSPLYKALIESGLGDSLIGGGVQPYRRQWSFSVGLDGMKKEDAADLEKLVIEELEKAVQNGLEPDRIEAALHQHTIALRRHATKADRGMQILYASVEDWMQGRDPIDSLKWSEDLDAFKQHITASPRYLEDLIQEHLINNPSRIRIDLIPDPDFEIARRNEEMQSLERFRNSLSAPQIAELKELQEKRNQFQLTPDTEADIAKLPRLERSDLEPAVKDYGVTEHAHGVVPILSHDLQTNGLTFQHMSLELSGVPRELLPYMRLYSKCLTQLGLTDEDYVSLQKRMMLKTDGVGASVAIHQTVDTHDIVAYLDVGGAALEENSDELLNIISDCVEKVDFSRKERFKEILGQERAGIEKFFASSGHVLAMNRLAAGADTAGAVKEELYGIKYLEFLRGLEKRVDSDWSSVQKAFEDIHHLITTRQGVMVDAGYDAALHSKVQSTIENRLNNFPTHPILPQLWDAPLASDSYEGLVIASPVNYVAWSINLYDQGYERDGSMEVLRKLLGSEYLWKKVREQCGAYGCFTSFNEHTGEFTCCSYRDPNIEKTVEAYRGIPEYLRNLQIDDEELFQYIVGAIGSLDMPESVEEKMRRDTLTHLTGRTKEDRQQYRDELLSTTAETIKNYADYFERALNSERVVVTGNDGDIQKSKADAFSDMKIYKI